MIRRFSAAVAAVAVTATVASGCSTFSSNRNAAEAGGQKLSVDDFEAILADYAEATAAPVDTTGGSIAATTTEPEVDGDQARTLLTDWISSQLTIAALAEAGIPIDDAARTKAATEVQTTLSAEWPKLDEPTRQLLIDERIALDGAGNSATDAAVQAAYESGIASSNTLCLRAMAFPSEDAATDAYAQLQSGTDFAELADKNNTDASAPKTGGIITDSTTGNECQAATGVTQSVAQSMATLAVGEASAPLTVSGADGSTGYFILLQRPWAEIAAMATPLVREALASELQPDLIGHGSAHVDSRYGTWDPETASVVTAR